MGKLSISEFGTRDGPAGGLPIAEQSVTIGPASAICQPLTRKTLSVLIAGDMDCCLGFNASAERGKHRLAAGASRLYVLSAKDSISVIEADGVSASGGSAAEMLKLMAGLANPATPAKLQELAAREAAMAKASAEADAAQASAKAALADAETKLAAANARAGVCDARKASLDAEVTRLADLAARYEAQAAALAKAKAEFEQQQRDTEAKAKASASASAAKLAARERELEAREHELANALASATARELESLQAKAELERTRARFSDFAREIG